MGITKVATMIVAISKSLKNQNPLCIHARGPLLDATPSVKIDISKKKNVTENDTLYIAMYPVSFIQFSEATVRSIHVALKSRNKDCKPLCMLGESMEDIKPKQVTKTRQYNDFVLVDS